MNQKSNKSAEIDNCSIKKDISESDKLEYQEAARLWQDDSRLRRQGLTFSVTLQGVIVAILSKSNLDNSIFFIALATLAIFVAFLSFNNDRRLSLYMKAYETRLIELETKNKLRLYHQIMDVAKTRTRLLTNEIVFGTFFILLTVGWAGCIIWKVSAMIN